MESRQVGRGSRAGEAHSRQMRRRLDGSKGNRPTLRVEAIPEIYYNNWGM